MPTMREKVILRMRADGKNEAEIAEKIADRERTFARLPPMVTPDGKKPCAGFLDIEEEWDESDIVPWATVQARRDVGALSGLVESNDFLFALDRPEFADGSQLRGALAADKIPADFAALAWEAYVAAAKAEAKRLRGEG